MIYRLLAAAIAISSFNGAVAQDNAGIFFFGEPPSVAQIIALADGASATSEQDGALSRVTLRWPEVAVTVTIDPAWDRDTQLAGMRGWLGGFPEEVQGSAPVRSFLADLDRTRMCYGSTMQPAFDHDGKAASLLKRMLAGSGGFFFSHQSFYTADGKRVAGLDGDPDQLGPK